MTAEVAAASPTLEHDAEGARRGAFDRDGRLDDLLVASGRHDEAAFAQLYELTSPWIYYLLRRRTGSTTDHETELVRVYTAIWHRASSFTPHDRSALAWVTRTAYDVVGS